MRTPGEYYTEALLLGKANGWNPEQVALHALELQGKDWRKSSKTKVLALVTTASNLPPKR